MSTTHSSGVYDFPCCSIHCEKSGAPTVTAAAAVVSESARAKPAQCRICPQCAALPFRRSGRAIRSASPL